MLTVHALLLPSDKKLPMRFRLAYLYFTMAHCQGQGKVMHIFIENIFEMVAGQANITIASNK